MIFVEFKCGVEDIYFEVDLIEKFKENCLLCVKLGVDLIVFDIYLGYMVVLNKLC